MSELTTVTRPFPDRGPYIRMHSGRKVYLKEPEWYLPDIAYHAAGVHRYTGGSRLSIGQHMIVAAAMAEQFYSGDTAYTDPLPARLLIHDAPEAVYGDMSSPLKRLCPDYCALLLNGERSFERWTGLTFINDPLVKEIDLRMWLTERQLVLAQAMLNGVDVSEDTDWCSLKPFPLTVDELYEKFDPWHSMIVEQAYTREFRRLLPWMEGK